MKIDISVQDALVIKTALDYAALSLRKTNFDPFRFSELSKKIDKEVQSYNRAVEYMLRRKVR